MTPKKFNPNEIVINSKVYHPIWGEGEITEYTKEKGIKVSFQNSVVKTFLCTTGHIFGEDHYLHLYSEPIKIERE